LSKTGCSVLFHKQCCKKRRKYEKLDKETHFPQEGLDLFFIPQYTGEHDQENLKTHFIVPTDAHYHISISACCAGVRFTARLHNRLICRHNIDCFYTDEHRKNHFVVLAKHRTAP
jgi:hypothetical protein